MLLKRKHKQRLHRTGALLLAALLFSVFFIQAAHNHHKHPQQKTVADQEQSDPAPELCKICDYFIHKQIKDFHMPVPLELKIPIPAPIQHSYQVFAGIYKFTLQGFTNKGPPVRA